MRMLSGLTRSSVWSELGSASPPCVTLDLQMGSLCAAPALTGGKWPADITVFGWRSDASQA